MMKLPVNQQNLEGMRVWGENERKGWAADIERAYLSMATAKRGRYRPQASSDGCGTIMLDDEDLSDPVRLEMEAWQAAREFYEADKEMLFQVHGCTDYRFAATMYLALQAAQLCCGGIDALPQVRKILELAIKALPAK
jgi:hypothetical protein